MSSHSLRYAAYLESSNKSSADPSKVIAFSVYGKKPDHTMGALRNVQIAPLYFPGWTVRLYTPFPGTTAAVPARLINKMRTLGADVVYVNNKTLPVTRAAWQALDDPTVSTVLLRRAEHRLSEHQQRAVTSWMKSPDAVFHCMRDHTDHAKTAIPTDLFGVRLDRYRQRNPGVSLMTEMNGGEGEAGNKLWDRYQDVFLCHDSVSCKKWPNSEPFPTARQAGRYEGQTFNSDMIAVNQKHDMKMHQCDQR